LYIAFSFFFLVILAFTAIRRSVLLFFVKAINTKYYRMLSDLLVVIGALILQVNSFNSLKQYLPVFFFVTRSFVLSLATFMTSELNVFYTTYSSKLRILNALCFSGLALFEANNVRVRRAGVFLGDVSKFFKITL